MPSKKRSAKLLSNLTPAEQRPDKYNNCSSCGAIKTKRSKHCRSCRFDLKHTMVSTDTVYIDGRPCRYIGLTLGKIAIVSEHRYDGLSDRRWQAYFDRRGHRWYALNQDTRPVTRMHREIIGGNSPHIDHINGDGLDNRDENLRPCTVSQNIANSRNHKTNKKANGRYKGVTFCKDVTWGKPWRARIGFQNTVVFIGRFATQKEAALAYDTKAVELFGDFAHLNFP